MTAQAPQSNNALGKRSLPSAFFAPLQTIGRYMDRQRSEPESAESGDGPAGSIGFYDPESPDEPALKTSGDGSADGGEDGSAEVGPDVSGEDSPAGSLNPARLSGRTAVEDAAHRAGAVASPAAFAEVALRVWGDSTAGFPKPNSPVVPPRDDAESARAGYAARSSTEAASGAPAGVPAGASAGAFIQPSAQSSLQSSVQSSLLARPEPAIAATPDLRPDLRLAFPPASGPVLLLESSTALSMCSKPALNEVQALAHDASNLLSALRLYGELLCFSGVLHERHLHYAEDLKLLSIRSEKIIDRLLQLAEQVALAEGAAPVRQSSPETLAKLALAGARTPGAQPAVRQTYAAESSRIAPSQFRPGTGLAGTGMAGKDGLRIARPGTAAPAADRAGEVAGTTSLPAVLNRIKGLLDTIAHGALEIDPGPGINGTGELPDELHQASRDGVQIAAPAETVERILVNLVSNAAVAIRQGGAVRIRAGLLNASGESSLGRVPNASPVAVLTVDDSGCGMSEAQVRAALGLGSGEQDSGELYCGKLYSGKQDSGVAEEGTGQVDGAGRGASSPSRLQRHGLGLSIVRELVAATGGRLLIHSRQGTGTRIEMRWSAVPPRSTDGLRSAVAWPGERNAAGGFPVGNGVALRPRLRPEARPEALPEVRPGAGFPAQAGRAAHNNDNEAAFAVAAKGAVA